MTKSAGIKGILAFDYGLIGEIKQTALLFDSVGIPRLDTGIEYIRERHKKDCMHHQVANELEFLREKGIIFNSWGDKNSTTLKKGADVKAIDEEFRILKDIISNPDTRKHGMDAAVRLSCLLLNNDQEHSDINAIPLITGFNSTSNDKVTKSDVINLIIEQMPIPDELTPWENIFEFKNNPDNIGRFAGLRTWVNKAVKSGNSVNEVKDELEYLLHLYRKNLETHKIKYSSGIIQSLVVGTAEFIENSMKFKFSEIAKGLFSASQTHVEVLKAELNSPGHDLAYIYQANRKFSKDTCS